MKKIKWKIIIVTCILCFASAIPGLLMWEKLPDIMPIHFNINNEPDNFASKTMAILIFPFLMAGMQTLCCVITDIKSRNNKFEYAAKWIIPIMSIILQISMVMFATGKSVDIRRVAVALVSLEMIVLGNYMPKLDYIKNYKIDAQKARKINRFTGFCFVIMGVLGVVSLLFSAWVSVVWLLMMIAFAICLAVFTMIKIKKQ